MLSQLKQHKEVSQEKYIQMGQSTKQIIEAKTN
jgi:hypothetical protein